MNGKARNFIPALANYNEQSWTLHNIMCRVSNWMGWNDNNTVLSRTVGRSENLEGQFLIKSILKETVFTSIPIKIYRDGLEGNCLSCTSAPPPRFWRPWLQGGTISQERYQKKECWLKMYKIIGERVHLGRFIQDFFFILWWAYVCIFLEQLTEMLQAFSLFSPCPRSTFKGCSFFMLQS